jgi:Cu-processing system ATP-binding protein
MAIEVKCASQRFGEVQALDGVSLHIGRGEMLGLIGHNGAGKSSLFKLMLGLARPVAGEVLVEGVCTSASGFREVRRRIGYLPENFVTYDNLSGLEVLALFARLKGTPATDCARVLEQVGLAAAAKRRVRGYSKGMRQRLGFAQALLGQPSLVFLDEPTNGLDPEGIHDFYAILRQLREAGTTIVITSHILAEIEQRVDRLAIMAGGRLAGQGTLAQLRGGSELPCQVQVQAAPGRTATVAAALSSVQGLLLKSVTGEVLRLHCERPRKLALLSALAALGAAVADVQLHEPTLEDLFLQKGGAHAASH